ncbi:hypothetical protein BDA99DRAFT_508881 [Phascolomyces articulosus]|uniref:CNH domain-containing protein n=1 Tax=Phascolomyces articulosus TaxID=60185 RepID=A0AAD5KAK6_9FUNG|nr:hypothetical protein BDA99DRAFT_508881 [Phascolomyces articulosus]
MTRNDEEHHHVVSTHNEPPSYDLAIATSSETNHLQVLERQNYNGPQHHQQQQQNTAGATTTSNTVSNMDRLLAQMDLKILASETGQHWPTAMTPPFESCCVLDDRFMLLGHATHGIQVLDLYQPTMSSPKTIIWVRVRQMVPIKPCRVVLMLAGRNKRVRCYSYDALLRLCYAVFKFDWNQRQNIDHDVPSMKEWKKIGSQCGKSPEEEHPDYDNMYQQPRKQQPQRQQQSQQNKSTPSSSSSSSSQPSPGATASTTRLVLSSGLTLKQHYICNDVILQEFYYKFPDCRDVVRLHTYQTSTYVFAAVMQRDKIVVWQQRRHDQQQQSEQEQQKNSFRLSPFYRFKVYWIPAEPRWISFADDRITLRYLLAIFSTEATAIGLRNSKVRTIPVDAKVAELYQKTWLREQYDNQLLASLADTNNSNNNNNQHTDSLNKPINTTTTSTASSSSSTRSTSARIRSHSSPHPPPSPTTDTNTTLPPSASFPTLPTTTMPDIQWTSLVQLPFYPNPLTTSLTSDYSNPPSYDTVVTSSPSEAVDPVALSSTMSPQLFFATLCRQSYIIDLTGGLFSTLVYHWTYEPQHIEFIQLTEEDWCAVGFSRESVEVLHMRTGEKIHRIMNGVRVNYLGRWDVRQNGKKKAKALLWCCATPQDNAHVYMLQGNINATAISDLPTGAATAGNSCGTSSGIISNAPL